MIENATPPKPKSSTLSKISKALIIPLAVACMGAWTDYRLKREKLRADVGYETVAPVLKELQTQVATLGGQVAVLQQLVLVMSQRRSGSVGPATAPVDVNAALDVFKDKLVIKVQKSQGISAPQQRVPTNLDDVIQTKK